MRAPIGSSLLKSGNAMPSDRNNVQGNKPLLPTISQAALRAANTAPVTPRIAGTVPSNNSTPLIRRATRQDATPIAPYSRDQQTTPSSILSNNITPRSGSRKSRVDSTNTTPSHTPTASSVAETSQYAGVNSTRSSYVLSPSTGTLPRAAASPSPASSENSNPQNRNQAQSQAGSKFFFANDARPGSAQALRPRATTARSNGFMHANGEAPAAPGPSLSMLQSGNLSPDDRPRPKFFHASSTGDSPVTSPQLYPRPGSSLSNISQATVSRVAKSTVGSVPRPQSPTKFDNATNTPLSGRGTPVFSPPPAAAAVDLPSTRSEVGSPLKEFFECAGQQPQYAKHPSISRLDDAIAAHLKDSVIRLGDVPRLPAGTTERTSLSSNGDSVISSTAEEAPSGLRSPVRAGQSLERMNELAAEARRERRVLDLEITNSSLEAINRTLERKMRKQTAELRRYRRLSRTGRLSIASSAARSSLGTVDEDFDPFSDLGEFDEEEDDMSDETMDEESLSPSALAESDARHRKRDEERLQLDLSKHQQLLIDSQKMNQSLKRCLDWTEELIKDGKKALEYTVNVSDVQLGGRVLTHDDDDDDEDTSLLEGFGNPIYVTPPSEEPAQERREDRDSGIDMARPMLRSTTTFGKPSVDP